MSGVVCPIRGGHESRPTIESAIHHAKERNLPIYFLFVIDLGMMGLTEVPAHTKIISHEMANLASFVLLTAKIEAKRKDIQAEGFTRFGHLADEIIALIQEKTADMVVLGQTRTGKEREITTNSLATKIQDQTQAEVILV